VWREAQSAIPRGCPAVLWANVVLALVLRVTPAEEVTASSRASPAAPNSQLNKPFRQSYAPC